MKIIMAQEALEESCEKTIFLAGPTPREKNVQSWRPHVISIFDKLGFEGTLLIPEMRGGFTDDFEYGDQIDWEMVGLEMADVIMFWIPRELRRMPAFTTNIEFGIWITKNPNKIVIGYPHYSKKMDYIEYLCQSKGITTYHDIEETVKITMEK